MISWGGKDQFLDDMQVVDIEPFIARKRAYEREIERTRVSKLWWTLAFIFGAFCYVSVYVWITR